MKTKPEQPMSVGTMTQLIVDQLSVKMDKSLEHFRSQIDAMLAAQMRAILAQALTPLNASLSRIERACPHCERARQQLAKIELILGNGNG